MGNHSKNERQRIALAAIAMVAGLTGLCEPAKAENTDGIERRLEHEEKKTAKQHAYATNTYDGSTTERYLTRETGPADINHELEEGDDDKYQKTKEKKREVISSKKIREKYLKEKREKMPDRLLFPEALEKERLARSFATNVAFCDNNFVCYPNLKTFEYVELKKRTHKLIILNVLEREYKRKKKAQMNAQSERSAMTKYQNDLLMPRRRH
jgi:hypothetical protein